jgi:hypothetical protein
MASNDPHGRPPQVCQALSAQTAVLSLGLAWLPVQSPTSLFNPVCLTVMTTLGDPNAPYGGLRCSPVLCKRILMPDLLRPDAENH